MAFSTGLRSGLLCAALVWLYTAYYLSRPGQPFSYTADDAFRVMALALVLPATVLIVSALRGRLQRLVDEQTACSEELTRANFRIESETAQRQRIEEQLRIREQRQAATMQLSQMVLPDLGLDTIMQQATTILTAQLGTSVAQVLELQPDGYGFTLRASSGDEGAADFLATGLPSYTLTVHEPVLVKDFHRETRFSFPQAEHTSGDPSAISAPIEGRERSYGVLIAGGAVRGQFQPDDLEFLAGIAQILAFAVEKDRSEAELRQRDEQLRQSHKMDSVGRLAGGIAHDFNNLLTVMVGFSELVRNTLDGGDQRREFLTQTLQAGERATWLVNQLLAFSRQQPLNPVVLDLKLVLQDMEKLLQRVLGEDIELKTHFGDSPTIVRADPGQIEQIALNLAANARDAMPSGGRLTIKTSLVYLDRSHGQEQSEVPTGAYVQLVVADTGHGMDESTQGRIFEPFFTTKEVGKGTGLGLSTVYGIVQQSGGDIEVSSEPGCGTTFRIHLPLVDAPPTRPETTEPTNAVHYGNETILLVEDEPGVRALASAVLQTLGYQVLEASGGHEALTRAVRHETPIDMVITDLVMPGMGGREVVKQLAERYPGLRVLYMSGFSPDAPIGQRAVDEQVAFLAKPFAPLELAQKVREVLDSTRRSEAPSGA